ncbi:S8 family serine peptidase [bacterium]|nr:S8 family serine peptidase [bacterium]
MRFDPRTIRRLSATLAMCGLAGCAALPPGTQTTGAVPPDVTWLNPPTGAGAEYAADRVIVKLKQGQAVRSVQGMRMVQAVEGLGNTALYAVPSGSSVPETLAKLRHDSNVVYAEPNYIYHATDFKAQSTVNDPMVNQLWGLTKVQAQQAWDVTAGDPNVVVAVVDTGVDYNHEDLKGQVIKGPDFGNNDNDPMDDQGHGSHVAGTIAAIANNGVGVAGLAYKTKVLAIKVLGSDGSGDTNSIVRGILKANELGARVINLSLGGPQQSSALKDAVDQVTAKGSLCVVAAGNDGTSTPDYPAAYPNALAVGASDQSDKRASFSNYGSYVDIAAPGVDILSSTEKSYKKHSGTSMASPHVAAAAALLLAKNPDLSVQQLRDALTTTGDPTTGFGNSAVKRMNAAKALAAVGGTAPAPEPEPGTSPGGEDTQSPSVPTGVKALAASTTQVQLEWNAASDNVGVTGYRIYRNGQMIATTASTGYADSGLAPGTSYAYTVVAYDAAGNASGMSNVANVQTPSSSSELTISNVTLKGLTRTSATIGWTTSVDADSRIDYTASSTYYMGYWRNVRDSAMTTSHSLTLPSLASGDTYYLKVTSVDANGKRVTAGLYGLRMP